MELNNNEIKSDIQVESVEDIKNVITHCLDNLYADIMWAHSDEGRAKWGGKVHEECVRVAYISFASYMMDLVDYRAK